MSQECLRPCLWSRRNSGVNRRTTLAPPISSQASNQQRGFWQRSLGCATDCQRCGFRESIGERACPKLFGRPCWRGAEAALSFPAHGAESEAAYSNHSPLGAADSLFTRFNSLRQPVSRLNWNFPASYGLIFGGESAGQSPQKKSPAATTAGLLSIGCGRD